MRSFLLATVALALLAETSQAHAQELTEGRRIEAARRLQEASVTIGAGRASGSGFVVGPEHWVVTNSHVVATARGDVVQVRFGDGTTRPGRVLATQPRHDLAVIEVPGDVPVRPLTLGDSGGVQVGQTVLAFGSPYGLEGTLTQGIVSALRDLPASEGVGAVQGLIQTDATINPGNSGGPLVNSRGEVIGVNTAILSRTGGSHGIGFAVPSAYVRELLDGVRGELRERHAPTPAEVAAQDVTTPVWLGIYGDDVQTSRFAGVRVRHVVAGGPAERAGLRGTADPAPPLVRRLGVTWTGHIIIALDGQPVRSMEDLHRMLTGHEPGDQARLTVAIGTDGLLTGEASVELDAPPR